MQKVLTTWLENSSTSYEKTLIYQEQIESDKRIKNQININTKGLGFNNYSIRYSQNST